MKKKILLGIFALAVAFQAGAQDKAFNFGFKVAPAISWLSIDSQSYETDGSAAKCNWGFFGAWNFTENLSVVSGFNVNFLGGNYKLVSAKSSLVDVTGYSPSTPNININKTNKIRLGELELPVAFQMRTNDINDFKFYVQIGLASGYIFRAKGKDDKNIDNRHLNTSYFVAGGVEYAVTGGVSLIGQLKYNGGLTSVMSTSHFAKTKANFVELGLGVMF